MKKLFTTKKVLIGAFVFALTSLSAYVFLFLSVKESNQNISSLQNQISIEVGKQSREGSTKNLLANTEESRKMLSTYFVNKEEIVEFIESIEDLAKKSGASLRLNSVGEEDEIVGRNQVSVLVISLQADGSWAAVHSLLASLESIPYKIHFREVSLEVSDSKVWTGKFEFTVVKN